MGTRGGRRGGERRERALLFFVRFNYVANKRSVAAYGRQLHRLRVRHNKTREIGQRTVYPS